MAQNNTVTIYRTWRPAVTSTSTCGGVSVTWTAGVEYASPVEILTRLNSAWASKVSFTLDHTTGTVTVTPVPGQTYTVALGTDNTLAIYLGFNSTSFTETKLSGDQPCLGHWHGAVTGPWGAGNAVARFYDNPTLWGRTNAPSGTDYEISGGIRLWVHRRSDTLTLAQSLDAFYTAADLWVRGRISIIDATGNTTTHIIRDDWECAPVRLDSQTVTCDVETLTWGG